MNYRQWKKKYKKRYGVNPPISVDKRKQCKQAVKVINSIDFDGFVNNMRTVFSNAFLYIGDAFRNIGESLKQ